MSRKITLLHRGMVAAIVVILCTIWAVEFTPDLSTPESLWSLRILLWSLAVPAALSFLFHIIGIFPLDPPAKREGKR